MILKLLLPSSNQRWGQHYRFLLCAVRQRHDNLEDIYDTSDITTGYIRILRQDDAEKRPIKHLRRRGLSAVSFGQEVLVIFGNITDETRR